MPSSGVNTIFNSLSFIIPVLFKTNDVYRYSALAISKNPCDKNVTMYLAIIASLLKAAAA